MSSNMQPYNQLTSGRDEAILEPELAIIDSAHHLFHRPALRYMFEDYVADVQSGHRIVSSVYVETLAFKRASGPEMMQPLGEVEFANGAAAMSASGLYGETRICEGIVGFADLRFGSAIGAMLDRALEIAPERYRGVRQLTIEHPSDAPFRYVTNRPQTGIMKMAEFRQGFKELEARNLTFDAAVFHQQMPDLCALADEFPKVPIVLNHLGQAVLMELSAQERADTFEQWRLAVREAARRENVICKIGGLGLPFWGFGFETRTDTVGYRELAQAWKPFVETVIEAFGPRRCMMESNYPPDGRSCGWVPLWNALKYLCRDASPDDKAALFHGTAARVYRLQLP